MRKASLRIVRTTVKSLDDNQGNDYDCTDETNQRNRKDKGNNDMEIETCKCWIRQGPMSEWRTRLNSHTQSTPVDRLFCKCYGMECFLLSSPLLSTIEYKWVRGLIRTIWKEEQRERVWGDTLEPCEEGRSLVPYKLCTVIEESPWRGAKEALCKEGKASYHEKEVDRVVRRCSTGYGEIQRREWNRMNRVRAASKTNSILGKGEWTDWKEESSRLPWIGSVIG